MILKENRLPLINRAENPEADSESSVQTAPTDQAVTPETSDGIQLGSIQQTDSLRDVFIKFNTLFLEKFDSLNAVLLKIDKNLEKDKGADEDDEEIKRGIADVNKNVAELVKGSEKENQLQTIKTIFGATEKLAKGTADIAKGAVDIGSKLISLLGPFLSNPWLLGGAALGVGAWFGMKKFDDFKTNIATRGTGTRIPWGASKLQDVIMERESGGNPDATWNNWGENQKFSEMTISKVIEKQEEALRSNPKTETPEGTRSSAVGAFQITSETLKEVVSSKDSGIKPTDVFNMETQRKIQTWLTQQAADRASEVGTGTEGFRERMVGRWGTLNDFSGEQIMDMAIPYPDEEMKRRERVQQTESERIKTEEANRPTKTLEERTIDEFKRLFERTDPDAPKTAPKSSKQVSIEERIEKGSRTIPRIDVTPSPSYARLEQTIDREDNIKKEKAMSLSDAQDPIQTMAPQITTIDNSTTTVVTKLTPSPKDETYHRMMALTGSYDAVKVI